MDMLEVPGGMDAPKGHISQNNTCFTRGAKALTAMDTGLMMVEWTLLKVTSLKTTLVSCVELKL